MTFSAHDLEKIAQLACLSTNNEPISTLIEDLNTIIHFVDQLRSVNTQGIEPLFHPLALHQPLRADTVTEGNHVHQLEALAPQFDNDLYLAPQFIEQSK